jgi:UDP-N-acetylglucosamine transferase subunit ALG13
MLNKFDECWIPDNDEHRLSGDLSKAHLDIPIKFIGPLSRFRKSKTQEKEISVLAVLSGPEPQRSILQELLIPIMSEVEDSVLVCGRMDADSNSSSGLLSVFGHLLSKELETMFNSAELVICRSGYSSIMDLFVLDKRAILIPTPGQPEQEYLAKHLKSESNFLFLPQSEVNQGLAKLISSTVKSLTL